MEHRFYDFIKNRTGTLPILCASNFHAKLFRQFLPNLLRQPIMHAPRTFLGSVKHCYRRRGGDGYPQPDQSRKSEACKSRNFEPESVPRTKMANHAEGKQKNSRGNRRQSDETYINDAMDLLAFATVFAGGEVAFVVPAHLRRKAGYVIPPARQNLPYDWIDAMLTHFGEHKISHEFRIDYKRIGSKASVWDARSTRLQNNPPRVASAFSASLRAISGWLFCSDRCANTTNVALLS